MNNTDPSSPESYTRFHLNLQILADDFADKAAEVSVFCREDPLTLDGLRLYQPRKTLQHNYLYLVLAKDLSYDFSGFQHCAFAVLGGGDLSCFSETCRILQIKVDLFLFRCLQSAAADLRKVCQVEQPAAAGSRKYQSSG